MIPGNICDVPTADISVGIKIDNPTPYHNPFVHLAGEIGCELGFKCCETGYGCPVCCGA